MREIDLSTLVSPAVAESLFGKKPPEPVKPAYRVPVPEHLKFSHIPENIGEFIEGLLPNLRTYLKAKGTDYHNLDDTINTFVVYMLSEAPSRNNVPRFTLYDTTKSKLPYYKWFIRNLHFFVLQNKKVETIKAMRDLSLVDTSTYEEDMAPGSIHMYSVTPLENPNDPISEIFVGQLSTFLENYSKEHSATFCFESYAHYLFKAKLEGLSNNDIADALNISCSAVSQWLSKLKILVSNFFEEPVPSPL